MSRSGYSEELEQWELIRWRGAVRAATRGKRGQSLLRDMRDALDAMPVKALIRGALVEADGQRCALGVVAVKRGLELSDVDPEEPEEVAEAFGIARALAQEIAYMNDEWARNESAEERWKRMRAWVDEQLSDVSH